MKRIASRTLWTLAVWALLLGLAIPAALSQPAGGLGRGQVLVETGWLAANLTRPDTRLVDVSTTRETYDRGRIAGAVYLSIWTDLVDPTHTVRAMAPTREQFQAIMRRAGIRNTDAVILYDDTRSLNAARAFWIFKLYRHQRVAILNGGSGKWAAEGRPLVTETRVVAPSAYVAGERDDSIVATANDVLTGLERVFILDARSPREFAGLDVRSARGGRIPGAVNADWVLAVNPDGTFKPVEELRALYTRAGLSSKDRKAVLYCQTGVRSAHTWFVLRYLLGFTNVRNYDGSWEEWGNRTDLPVGR